MIRIEKISHKFPPIDENLPILRRTRRFAIPNDIIKGLTLDERINLLTKHLKEKK